MIKTKTAKVVNEDKVPGVIFNKWEEDAQLVHYFTTKEGGVSSGYFDSLNLGFNRGDDPKCVSMNYERLTQTLGIQVEDIVCAKQVHETDIWRITCEDRGAGMSKKSRYESGDGLYTTDSGVALFTYYADCVPLFFYAPGHHAIGVAHAGWRGTVKGIGAKMIKIWEEELGINPEEVEVAIGPSIGPCCFEVHSDVQQVFTEQFKDATFIRPSSTQGKYFIDLWECNKHVLLQAGVKEENIAYAAMCTCCHSDLFFSHRKTQGNRGTLAGVMYLK